MWCACSPETTGPKLNSTARQGEGHLWWTRAIVSKTGNIINERSGTAHIWQAVFPISLEPIHLLSNASNLIQISSSWWHEGICYWKIMINVYYHHLSYPSVSTFLNKLEEALCVFYICWVRGPEGLDCTSCHGQTLMKIIEDVIRRMCLLSEVAYGIITQSYTSLISIFHGFALPFINCMTLCHWRKCQW